MLKLRVAVLFLVVAATAVAQSSKPPAPKAPAKTPPARKTTPTVPLSPEEAAIAKKVESYLRKLYAWGPTFKVKVGAPTETPVAGLLAVSVEITVGGQSNTGNVYVSRDGRYLFQGDLGDLNAEPFAEVRKTIRLEDAPSQGPADAKVIVVEYGDFQCPSCRALEQELKTLKPNYPQVRFVYKDFPLSQIHAWAMTAALAGRCVYRQKPDAFWTFHDAIYDSQDQIKPDNAWDKMLEQAQNLGLDQAEFKACMASPEAKQAIEKSTQEGMELKIANTPTVFVNGRRLVGGDRELLEQYIRYELAFTKPATGTTPDR